MTEENITFKETNSWIGNVPVHWDISKIKYICKMNEQTLSEKTKDDFKIKYIDIGNVDSFGRVNNLTTYKFSKAPSRARRIVRKNDVLISTVRTYLGAIAYINESDENLVCSTGFAVLTPNEKIFPEFLGYFTRSAFFLDEIASRSYGVSYPAINSSEINSLSCILPSIEEQKLISNFLNKKTSEIDTLIEDKEKIIALLKEKRQAIITEAVTKGLNPDVKMKDSGVEWIGEIPEHWNTKKIKHLLSRWKSAIKTGPFGSHLSNKDMESDYKKVFNQKNVLKNNFDIGDYYISKDKYEELKSFEAKQGDLLITTRGTIGKAAIVPEGKDTGILHPCLIKLDINDVHYNPNLLEIIFNDTSIIKEQVYILSNSTTIEVIYSETLKNIFIPISPDLKEQDEIIKRVEEKKGDFLSLIDNITCQIQKLKEYRQSLIYEAVTGKIDIQEMLKETEQEEVSSS